MLSIDTKANQRYKFIVLEGIDGSGKTTVARQLAQAINGKFIRTPPPGFTAMRRHIDKSAKLPSRFLFYLCSVAYASEAIINTLQRRHVVCDRYVASTVAYHRALGLKVDWEIEQLNLAKPDFTFFLTVSDEAERRRRIATRGRVSEADILLENDSLRLTLRAEYMKFNMVEIDTAFLTVEEVLNKIRKHSNI